MIMSLFAELDLDLLIGTNKFLLDFRQRVLNENIDSVKFLSILFNQSCI